MDSGWEPLIKIIMNNTAVLMNFWYKVFSSFLLLSCIGNMPYVNTSQTYSVTEPLYNISKKSQNPFLYFTNEPYHFNFPKTLTEAKLF